MYFKRYLYLILGISLGRWLAGLYIRKHAMFLEASNLTWAEIQVEKQAIEDQEPICLAVGLVIMGVLFVMVCFKA